MWNVRQGTEILVIEFGWQMRSAHLDYLIDPLKNLIFLKFFIVYEEFLVIQGFPAILKEPKSF